MSQTNLTEQLQKQKIKLLQYANTKRIDGDFNDVTIEVGSESIPANRMVLACYSKFFESMFLSPMKERYQNTVEIKDFDGKAVKQVIEYIYTGHIDINTNNVLILLRAADFLQVNDVTKMCFDFMESLLTVDCCLEVVKVSFFYNNPVSLQQTYRFISDNFDEIAQSDNFKNLSKNELIFLFPNVNRVTVQETSLSTAFIEWIKHNLNRETDFSLFSNLDFQKFSSDFIATITKEPAFAKETNDCLKAVVSFLSRNANAEKESKILCLGGLYQKSVSEVYNIYGDPLNSHQDLPYNLSHHCALKLDDFLYCIGGAIGGSYDNSINKVFRLNLKATNSKWEEVASMAEKRSFFGATVYNGCLVVAGGYDGSSKLCATEMYEPSLNKWSSLAPLNDERDVHVLVAAGGKLFVIGGLDIWGQYVTSGEQLENLNGKWTKVKSMNVPRIRFAAVSCDNFIYAIGGTSGKTEKSVEKYDVGQDKWSLVSSMNIGRRDPAACVLSGYIFAVGGQDAQGNCVEKLECYDPITDEWRAVGETKQKLDGHAIVVV